jgi:hypothetical protein
MSQYSVLKTTVHHPGMVVLDKDAAKQFHLYNIYTKPRHLYSKSFNLINLTQVHLQQHNDHMNYYQQ